ncbi:MAG: ABC transporter permease subunit [Clostridia bacterium]|nr:ABC transporter permease subunit [Clostridia bacterium]
MTNLLAPNLKRLLKNSAFRIAAAVVAVIGLFEIFMMYRDSIIEMDTPYLDGGLFSFAALGVFALAAVVPLFVGSEYSDGTIRNKVVVGHHRASVYLSLLRTSLFAETLLILVWTAAYLIPGAILMEHANPLWVYLVLYLAMFLELAVFSVIFTLLTMTLGNKAGSAVVCILFALLLVMQGIVVKSMLEEPEFYGPEIIISDDGEVSYGGEMEPNPNYIPEGSPKRAFYNFLMDFMPGGQALQIAGHTIDNLSKICLYDIGWLVVLTGAGVLIFRQKDLK